MISLLLSATLLGAAPSVPPGASVPPAAPVSTRAPLVGAIGTGMVLSGGLIWLFANAQEGFVTSRPGNPAEIQVARWNAQQTQLGGMGLALLGACTMGIALAMKNWDDPPPRTVSATPLLLPGGGGLALSGSWP